MDQEGNARDYTNRLEYDKRDIPTAGFVDLTADLCDTSRSIESALPTAEHFCAAMGVEGVGDQSRVVLYDDSDMAWAARTWWMLRWVGFDQTALLDSENLGFSGRHDFNLMMWRNLFHSRIASKVQAMYRNCGFCNLHMATHLTEVNWSSITLNHS